MEAIGRIGRLRIFYLAVRQHPGWKTRLPTEPWVGFTIAEEGDEEMIPPVVAACLDHGIGYACSAGALGNLTEDFFDEEIAWRAVDFEMRTKQEWDWESNPMTTAHASFEEGFWYAGTVAPLSQPEEFERVICIDLTRKKDKQRLINLIAAINQGWLPPE